MIGIAILAGSLKQTESLYLKALDFQALFLLLYLIFEDLNKNKKFYLCLFVVICKFVEDFVRTYCVQN